MNITVVYDSIFGNTANVASQIANELEIDHNVSVFTVQEAKKIDLTDTDLLIVGSPTRGFQPTPGVSEYVAALNRTPEGMLAAAFDTRLDLETVNPLPLRWVVESGGYAAERIASGLKSHGLELRGDPAGFLVSGAEGPIKAGEIERARAWASNLLQRRSGP